MAGSGTRVTAEALATAIQNYEARKQEFMSAYTNINKVVQTLSSNYKSEAATSFYGKFFQIYANLEKTGEQMENAINKLKSVKEVYEALADAQQALVNSLQNDFTAAGNIFG